MVYRLTRRTHDLFPCDSNEMTLELLKSATEIHGPNAPEKLLFNVFERKTAALKEKVKGDTVADRAKWLAKQREKEGFMSQFITDEKEGGPQILECHSPIMNLLDLYPIIGRLEQDLVRSGPRHAGPPGRDHAPRACTSARSTSRSDEAVGVTAVGEAASFPSA